MDKICNSYRKFSAWFSGASLFTLIILGYPNASVAQTDSSTSQSPDTTANFNIPLFSTTGADAEADADQQDVSTLLQSSRDVFMQFASFQFGASYYRARGYSAENQQVMINGVNLNNLETGFSSWSNWGGLNDVTRYTENRFGTVSNRYGFSGPGGYTNIDSKASSFRKGNNFSYALANRTYRHRVMFTHSTGLTKKGWALTLSASNRNGDQVYIPGTYFNASSFYLSVDKKIKDKHLFSFTGFYSPMEQGRTEAAQLEAYQLAGNHYYNNEWGYQNGKVRNQSVSRTQRPILMLSHIYDISVSSRVSTSVYYTFGKNGRTRINWFNAVNPNRDYYKNFPSTHYEMGNAVLGDYYKNLWLTDVNFRQLNWDQMIYINQNNLFTLPSQLGQGLNTSETRARFIVENQVENLKNIGINMVYNKRVKDWFISAGFNANVYRNRKYKELEDLLGATFWLDYDMLALYPGANPFVQQNNINAPDKKIYAGDKFGYDYSINVNRAEAWSQVEYNGKWVDVYASLSLSDYLFWRHSYMANGKFPTTSMGTGEKTNFINVGAKGGAIIKLNGRHSLTTNASFITRPPEVNNMYIAPTVRQDLVSGIKAEQVISGDLNYIIKQPTLKLRFTVYYTQFNNQLWVRSFFHDNYNTFVNMIMKGVSQAHSGTEFCIEKTLFTSHIIQSAFGYGNYVYRNRPTLEAWQNNNSTSLYTNRATYIKNYYVGGTPQMVFGIGYRYNSKKFWHAGIYFNYFDRIFVEPNPDRRTAEAIGKYISNESRVYDAITKQERLPGYYIMNFNAGKSFRIAYKYYLRLNVSVNNILNNKNHLVFGYEQLRWDQTYLQQFDNKYLYMPGATYMASVAFSF